MLALHHYDGVKSGAIKPPAWMQAFKVSIPPGKRGPWTIENLEVQLDMANLRHMRDGRGCFPGTYTILRRNGKTIMSDTTAELSELREMHLRATGRVLIHGLGLGCVVKACLSKPEVTHIDVVEIDPDIIAMVAPHYASSRVAIHQGDCLSFKWKPGIRWNAVWHDIWDDICSDNLEQMSALHRRFSRRCDWQGSWAKDQCHNL